MKAYGIYHPRGEDPVTDPDAILDRLEYWPSESRARQELADRRHPGPSATIPRADPVHGRVDLYRARRARRASGGTLTPEPAPYARLVYGPRGVVVKVLYPRADA